MLRTTTAQGDFFTGSAWISSGLAPELKRGTIYHFLWQWGDRLFPDQAFARMYSPDRGRPAVPPSILMKSLVLKYYTGVSDAEVVERATYDYRWCVVNNTQLGIQPFAKSTFQLFRARLFLHKSLQKILADSLRLAETLGLKSRSRFWVALDTTHVLGAAAARDTYDWLADLVRRGWRLLNQAHPKAARRWLARGSAQEGLGDRRQRYFGKSLKGSVEIDWDDPEERARLATVLLEDVQSLLEELQKQCKRLRLKGRARRQWQEVLHLMEEVALQDLESDESGGVRVRRGTARDRRPSVQDPDMRHGRKSSSGKFNGYKGALAVDVDSGLVVAATVIKANEHDSRTAVPLVGMAEQNTGQAVERMIGDTAYGTAAVRKAMAERGIPVTAKAPPASHRKPLDKSHFQFDPGYRWVRCPAGHVVHRRGRKPLHELKSPVQFIFPARLCRGCPLRGQCTGAQVQGRTVRAGPDSWLLERARAEQRSAEFRRVYRLRTVAERTIRLVKRCDGAKSRYFGQEKTEFHWVLACIVANLVVLACHDGRRGPHQTTGARKTTSSWALTLCALSSFLLFRHLYWAPNNGIPIFRPVS